MFTGLKECKCICEKGIMKPFFGSRRSCMYSDELLVVYSGLVAFVGTVGALQAQY